MEGFKLESSAYFSPHVAHPLFYLPLPHVPFPSTVHSVTILVTPKATRSQNE